MDEFTADAMSDAIDDVDGLRDGLLKMLQEKGTGWTKRTLADFLAVQRWMRDGAPDEIVKMVVPTREEHSLAIRSGTPGTVVSHLTRYCV